MSLPPPPQLVHYFVFLVTDQGLTPSLLASGIFEQAHFVQVLRGMTLGMNIDVGWLLVLYGFDPVRESPLSAHLDTDAVYTVP